MRCPFQCGVKVLVRNLEKHKNYCPKRNPAESEEGISSPASCAAATAAPAAATTTANHAPPTNKIECETGETAGEKGSNGPGQEGPGRTVTCMRCHESLPFNLVPSHGPKCKGKKIGSEPPEGATAAAAAAATSAAALMKDPPSNGPPHLSSPVSAQLRTEKVAVDAGSSREAGPLQPAPPFWGTAGKAPPPLPSSGDLGSSIPKAYPARSPPPSLYPPSDGTTASWQGAGRKGGAVSTPDARHPPPSPPRPKSVRSWGTRQVASWLREIMRPPRADIISRFHESGVVGTTLLGLTDRYPLNEIQPKM